MPITPDLEPTPYRFADDGRIPNNPVLPFLLYPGALPPETQDFVAGFEALFTGNGWPAAWRNGIYPFPHYHSVCHEALGVGRGTARVRFGGATGIVLEIKAGDAVLLPAGTGHQNLGASEDLLVIGAYPHGSDYDLCRGAAEERPGTIDAIAGVPLPGRDPVLGALGGVTRLWPTS
jgi:uncharacterized protein YjlB